MSKNHTIPATTPPHGGDVYHLARSLGLELADLLDFSANINPLGFPVGIQTAIRRPWEISSITRTAAAWTSAGTWRAFTALPRSKSWWATVPPNSSSWWPGP